MYMILSADDIVIFTTNPISLQSQIESIHHYSEQWGLKINANKTKVCISKKENKLITKNFILVTRKLKLSIILLI